MGMDFYKPTPKSELVIIAVDLKSGYFLSLNSLKILHNSVVILTDYDDCFNAMIKAMYSALSSLLSTSDWVLSLISSNSKRLAK